MRWVLRSKIHQAKVTETHLDYVGSLTIDQDLIEKAGLWPGEKVLVVSNTTGARLETYVIAGQRGSGVIGANGAAARLMQVGDELIIMGFELAAEPITPSSALVDADNKFVRYLGNGCSERARRIRGRRVSRATLKDGVLTARIPKRAEFRPRRIEVRQG